MTNSRNYIKTVFLFAIVLPFSMIGQSFDQFYERAWSSNKMISSKEFSVDEAKHQLKEAKALYGPSIAFNTQYTLAVGGRDIDFPIGDLLNPVYNSLNDLTQTNNFPSVENQSINFLPNNFYDLKFRIQQPLLTPELGINKALKSKNVELKELEINAYKKMLSKNIIEGIINAKRVNTSLDIYSQAEKLIGEGLRTTESMVSNGIALPSAINRIKTESINLQAQKLESQGQMNNALDLLKHLIDKEVTIEEVLNSIPSGLPTMEDNKGEREEILQLEKAIEMNQLAIDNENLFYKPKVGVALDVGSQAFNFGLKPYALLGLNLDLNIFDNKRHSIRKSAAMSNALALNSEKEYYQEQIDLQTKVARSNLRTAILQAETIKNNIDLSKSIYRSVLHKYKEGIANYLELIDAQNQVTQSELSYALAEQNAWLKWADFKYANGSL